MGIRHHEQGTAFPSKRVFFSFFLFFMNCAPPLIFVLCTLNKKGSLCRLKINHASGSESCVYSWYTGLHGSKKLQYHGVGSNSLHYSMSQKKAPVAKSQTLLFFIPRGIWNQFFADFFA
jgi:hypothetical protein